MSRRNAWMILVDAEHAAGVMTMVEERASYADCDQPRCPEDYMAWIKDEIHAQEGNLDAEDRQLASYIELLRGIVAELEALGLVASPEPWVVPA